MQQSPKDLSGKSTPKCSTKQIAASTVAKWSTVMVLGLSACVEPTVGPDVEEPTTLRVTVYANAAFGPGSTPTEVRINGVLLGTLTQALDTPPANACDQPGGVSITVNRNGPVRMSARRVSDGANWGEYDVDKSSGSTCVVAWVGAHMFPPLGGGGGGGNGVSAVNTCLTLDPQPTALGFSQWRNSCGFKVNFAWFDEGPCRPTPIADGSFFGCGSTVAANSVGTTTGVKGRYVYGACRDPHLPVKFRDLRNGLPSAFACN
jgi:hypothetical protein